MTNLEYLQKLVEEVKSKETELRKFVQEMQFGTMKDVPLSGLIRICEHQIKVTSNLNKEKK